jgi:hypothetical protein
MRVFCLFLSLAAFAVPAELLSNGDFRSGLDGWKVRRHKEFHHINARLGRAEGVPTVSVAITKPAAPQYFILEQAVDIKEGKYYRLSAELRLAGEGKVGLMVKQDHDPWAPLPAHGGARRCLDAIHNQLSGAEHRSQQPADRAHRRRRDQGARGGSPLQLGSGDGCDHCA